MLSKDHRIGLLIIVAAISVVGLFFTGRISQDQSYHLFADTQRIWGMPNFWNVVSNLPFLLVGGFGLWRYPRLAHRGSVTAYVLLCVGVSLVGFGSAYYHYAPSNASLLWDRLPITVAFMALFSMLLGERGITREAGTWLWSLVGLGIAAVLYWAWTESLGKGDLRPYIIVQFLPIILMPLILFLFQERYLKTSFLLYAFAFYLVAKVLEHFDHQIEALTGVVSGHPLKHIVAAIAVLYIIIAVPVRDIKNSTPDP